MRTQQVQLRDDRVVTIRSVVPEDAAKILEYVDRVSGETDFLAQGRGELGWTLEKERKFIEDYRSADNKLLILAEIENEIAGALGFTGGERTRMRHSGELGIAVVQEYWGLGLGTSLMECLIAWAKSSGLVRKITLRTRIDNERALHLYEHFGFVREGVVTRLFEIAGEFYDGYLLGLEIDPQELMEIDDVRHRNIEKQRKDHATSSSRAPGKSPTQSRQTWNIPRRYTRGE